MKHTATAGALAALALSYAPALAADMPVKAAPIYIPPPLTWTGPYAGVNAGGAWFDPKFSTDIPGIPLAAGGAPGGQGIPPPPPPPCMKHCYSKDPLFGFGAGTAGGFVGGAQAGYNYQFAPQWVAGIEGDFDGASLKASGSVNFLTLPGSVATSSESINWLASLRGRIGYLWSPAIMIYGTGGAAWADVDYDASATVRATPLVSATTSFDKIKSGWVAGAGAEWMWRPNIILRAEYLFYSFNGASATTPLSPNIAAPVVFAWDRINLSVIRLGASYRF